MAITLSPIQDKGSVYDGQITIDDNFKIVEDALNDLLNVFNRSSGRINNADYSASTNDIRTKGIVVTRQGVTLIRGDLNLNNGNIYAKGATATIGFGGGSYMEKVSVGATSANFSVISFKGNTNHSLALPAVTPSQMQAMKDSGELPDYAFAVMVGGTGATGPVFYDGTDWKKVDLSSI